MVPKKVKYKIEYFVASHEKEADSKASIKLTEAIHHYFKDMFSDIGCLKGTFLLQVKEGSKVYKTPPRCVTYALQQPFKEELECQQKQQIIIPLADGEASA